ncbi:dihydroneopterin aldolase [Candidatus Marinamargulisbacteria bacterium SCGC AAA071-K20]|nr:dihydroneopterin aldolase [Candidatus Marinamargulisbacteria bacterium SCGC AAA071-K20]
MDKLLINGFIIDAKVGIYASEKLNTQKIQFDLEISTSLNKAGKSDNIRDTVDYGQVTRVIREIINTSNYNLLEALAEDIIESLFVNKMIERVKISILKLDAIADVQSIGISIKRER